MVDVCYTLVRSTALHFIGKLSTCGAKTRHIVVMFIAAVCNLAAL